MSKLDDDVTIRTSDLAAAVGAGILSRNTADQLISFVQNAPVLESANPDDEQLRLVTGFNDIFVTIGIALFISAILYLGGFVLIPFVVWGLAEIFTRKRRMALPSIVLLVIFATSITGLISSLMGQDIDFWNNAQPWKTVIVGVVAAAAIGLHWLRFHVPITVAAGCAVLVMMIAALAETLVTGVINHYAIFVFMPLGLIVFGCAMWFDMSDRNRRTRRSDIAFWLHLLAAPLIVHSIMWRSFVGDSVMTSFQSLGIFAVFAVLCFVALVVDRRALLVSSLIYLGYALSTVFGKASSGQHNFGLALLGVGAVVLMLSVAWQPLRKLILGLLPETVLKRVPPPHMSVLKQI